MSEDSIGKWMSLIRANFLPLTVVIVAAGLVTAVYQSNLFNPLNALLTLVGALLAHIATNVLNNYFDYRMGVDERTVKTPFSGGVDVLVDGEIKPSHAYLLGLSCLMGAAIIGLYFLRLFFWPLVPILVYGGISIYFYTAYLTRIPALSEIIAGTNLGLVVLGAYITQTGSISAPALAVSIPASILCGLLLFLNEFPDMEADRLAGRRHLIVLLGREQASKLYAIVVATMYLSIIGSVCINILPLTALVALATLPLGFKATRIALRNHSDSMELIPALASNVQMILATIGLITIGIFVAIFL